MDDQTIRLVTKGGECFDALFERKEAPALRDVVFYLFRVTDCKNRRGTRLISLARSGPAKFGIDDYESRIEMVRLNTLRRAFDSGILSFNSAYDDETYKELTLDVSDFNVQPPAEPEQIMRLIKHKAYWLGFKYNDKPGVYLVRFDTEIDLEYLGAGASDVQRYVWLLREQGFLQDINSGTGRPTKKLVDEYEPSLQSQAPSVETGDEWDVFISHASEDKEEIARPLADALQSRGLRVWYDDFSLRLGDSLRQSIDRGLARSRFGIVILSTHFFEKHWPQVELNGLATREVNSEKVILPVWHRLGFTEVRNYSVTLADRLAVQTKDGLANVVEKIIQVVRNTDVSAPTCRVAELGVDLFTEDLQRHVRQAVGYTMTLSGQLLLRWLLIQGRIECLQQFMPEIPRDTQNEQMEIAVNAGIVRREQEQGGLLRTFFVVNPEIQSVLQRVLPELLSEPRRDS